MTTDHGPLLEQLRHALEAAGWSSTPRYDSVPALLRVPVPGLSTLGDSVSVRIGPDSALWFWSSTGRPLGACEEVTRARDAVTGLLGPYATAAARL